MFCQPSENNKNENKLVFKNLPSKNKQKKKLAKKAAKKNHSRFQFTMSTWAENFTVAATWQLKHQISYWKARAKSLEYENAVLHDVIRRNHCKLDLSSESSRAYKASINESQVEEYEESEEEGDFEVSEEFVQFLAENAKFKEDARRERERLKAKQDEENEVSLEQEPRETIQENRERLNGLYGKRWQRVSALETNMLSKFISESDKHKPVYWPNIPFNFNYS